MNVRVCPKFEPHDLWIGVYWKWYRSDPERTLVGIAWMLELYVCILPTLPLYLMFWRRREIEKLLVEQTEIGSPRSSGSPHNDEGIPM